MLGQELCYVPLATTTTPCMIPFTGLHRDTGSRCSCWYKQRWLDAHFHPWDLP